MSIVTITNIQPIKMRLFNISLANIAWIALVTALIIDPIEPFFFNVFGSSSDSDTPASVDLPSSEQPTHGSRVQDPADWDNSDRWGHPESDNFPENPDYYGSNNFQESTEFQENTGSQENTDLHGDTDFHDNNDLKQNTDFHDGYQIKENTDFDENNFRDNLDLDTSDHWDHPNTTDLNSNNDFHGNKNFYSSHDNSDFDNVDNSDAWRHPDNTYFEENTDVPDKMDLDHSEKLNHANNEVSRNITELDNSEQWGLPDAVAYIGKLFRYPLPKSEDVKNADHLKFQMTKQDIDELSDWLYWNEESNSIEGVAKTELIGDVIHVYVTQAHMLQGTLLFGRESFSIRVLNSTDQNLQPQLNNPSSEVEIITCGPALAVTQATVVIDVIMDDFTAQDNVQLLKNFGLYLNLPVMALTMLPGGEKPLWHDDALVAGPGDTPEPKNLPGTVVQWIVGCGNVQGHQIEILELLETAAINESLSATIGHGIIGWYITNNRPAPERSKIKRQASILVKPTLTPGPVLDHPTAYPIVSHIPRYNSSGHRPNDLQPSMWLRPQLEIFITTRPVAGSQPKPTEGTDFGPTRATSIIQPTRIKEFGHTESWPRQYTPDSIHSSEEWPGKPTPGYPGYIEPSIEYGSPTHAAPTASLPVWTRYPDEIHSTPDWRDEKYRTKQPDWTASGSIGSTGYPSASQFPGTPSPGKSSDDFGRPIYSSTIKPFESLSITATPVTPTSGWLHPSTLVVATPSASSVRPKKRPTTTPSVDSWPRLMNPLQRLTTEVGRVLSFQIPSNTFYDKQDGYTENLRLLQLLNDNHTEVSPFSWIKMDKMSQTIYGFALDGNIGKHRFFVAVVDKDNHIEESPLVVDVRAPKDIDRFTHEFTLKLDIDYDKFMREVQTRIAVVSKLAKAFGDADAQKITVTNIVPGSVTLHWTNNSLPLEPCPRDAILKLHRQILLADGSVNKTFVKAMAPYEVMEANGKPLGICATHEPSATASISDVTSFATKKSTVPPIKMTPGPEEPARKEVPPSSFLLYVVIAIIIFLILLIILIVVCVVCYKQQRNRRERKKNEEEAGTSKKGIPIIFADELEQSGVGNGPDEATPVSTLKSVKSIQDTDTVESVPPPEYPRSKPGSASSTLRSDWKAPLLDDSEDVATNSQENTLEKPKMKESNDAKKATENNKDGSKNAKSVR